MPSPQIHSNRPAPAHRAARTIPETAEIRLLDSRHPGRRQAEAWVRRVYFHAYRARLEHFYPWFLSVTSRPGRFISVAGVRPAAHGPLFSEHYLDRPVEILTGIPRRQIVEVGNLAPASPGQARAMITTVTAFLHGAGFREVVFTAVPRLVNAFRRLGLEPVELGPALPERLPGDSRRWGSYYEAGPRVYHGDIAGGHAALCTRGPGLDPLHRKALELGHTHGLPAWSPEK